MAEPSSSAIANGAVLGGASAYAHLEDARSSIYSAESARTSGELFRPSIAVRAGADHAPASTEMPPLRPSTSLARRFHQVEREVAGPSVQRELNFSVKWQDDVRSFSIDTRAINSITYRDLTDLFEVTGDTLQTAWPSKARGRQRRSNGLLRRLYKRRKEDEDWSLFIEHQKTDMRPTSRPRSTWSVLEPWEDDGSLQVHLVRDFLRKQAMEQTWVMVLIRRRTQGDPDDDVAWSPSGLDRLGKGLSRLSWGLGNLLGTNTQTDSDQRSFRVLVDDEREEDATPLPNFPSYSTISASASTQPDKTSSLAGSTKADEGRKRRPSLANVFRRSTASRRNGQQDVSGEQTALLAESRAEDSEQRSQDDLRPSQARVRTQGWRIFGKSARQRGEAGRFGDAPPAQKRRGLLRFLMPGMFRGSATESSSNASEVASGSSYEQQPPRPWLDPERAASVKAKPRSASSPAPTHPRNHSTAANNHRGQLFERVDLADAESSPRQKYGQLPAIPGRVVSLSKSSHVFTRWGHNSSLSLDSHPTRALPSVDSVHRNQRREAAAPHAPSERKIAEKTDGGGATQDLPVKADARATSRPTAVDPPSPVDVAVDTATGGNRLWHFKPRGKRPPKRSSHMASRSETVVGALQAKNISPPLERLGRGASIVNRPEDARAGMRRAWTEGA